jgi:hypothetical protein
VASFRRILQILREFGRRAAQFAAGGWKSAL